MSVSHIKKAISGYSSAEPVINARGAKALANDASAAKILEALDQAPQPVQDVIRAGRFLARDVNRSLLPNQRIELAGKGKLELMHDIGKAQPLAAKNASFMEKGAAAVGQVQDELRKMDTASGRLSEALGATRDAYNVGQNPTNVDPHPLGALEEGEIERQAFRAARIEMGPLGEVVPAGTVKGPSKAVSDVADRLLGSGHGRAKIEEYLQEKIDAGGAGWQEVRDEFRRRIGDRVRMGTDAAGRAAGVEATAAEAEAMAGLRGLAAQEAGVGAVAGAVSKVGKLGSFARGVAGIGVPLVAGLVAESVINKEQEEYHPESFLSRTFGEGSEREAVALGFKERQRNLEARMQLERLQGDMAANTMRLATMRPDIYNQLLYKRLLPRGVTPIGGNPDDGFLNQVTLAMSSGAFTPRPSAEQEYADSM